MLGAGWQARSHLKAHDAVQDLERVRVYSPTPESREEYAAEMREELDLDVEAVDAPERAFEGAHIVQTVTNSTEPVFDLEWVESGTHVGVIRSTEAPEELFDLAAFDAFVQSWSQVTQLEEVGNRLNEREIPTHNVNNYIVEGDEPVPKFESWERDAEPLCDWSQVPGLGAVVAAERGEIDDLGVGRTDPDGVTVFYNRGMGI